MGGVGKWKWGSEREGYKRGERKIKIKVEERKKRCRFTKDRMKEK